MTPEARSFVVSKTGEAVTLGDDFKRVNEPLTGYVSELFIYSNGLERWAVERLRNGAAYGMKVSDDA